MSHRPAMLERAPIFGRSTKFERSIVFEFLIVLERLTEIGLFFLPFAVFVALRLGATRRWPSGLVLGGAGGALVLLLAGLVWFAHAHRLPADAIYVPARVSAGRILPGHAAR
ncbi:MAG: DUF6111 family protein [Acetobacteraceae bacterium]